MDALETASKLHEEAEQILYERGLDKILGSYGRAWYTGSYALDTMAWPDIDMIVLKDNPKSLEEFFELGREVAQMEGMYELKLWNTLMQPMPNLPRGLYWGGRLVTGNWKNPWKIDIWVTDEDVLKDSQAYMDRIRGAMDADSRKVIVEIKHELLLPEGRTPVGSGYHIYQAVLFEGMRTLKELRPYLRKQGIQGV